MQRCFLGRIVAQHLNTGSRKSVEQIISEMEDRQRQRLMMEADRARPFIEAAEAKRKRRRERNLRVAGVR